MLSDSCDDGSDVFVRAAIIPFGFDFVSILFRNCFRRRSLADRPASSRLFSRPTVCLTFVRFACKRTFPGFGGGTLVVVSMDPLRTSGLFTQLLTLETIAVERRDI